MSKNHHAAPPMPGSKRHPLRKLLQRMERHDQHSPAIPPGDIRLEVRDTGNAYLVQADLPGVGKRNVQVRIDGRRLSIVAAPRAADAAGDGGRALVRELRHGQRSRMIELPDAVDDQAAQASLAAGVLSIMLPKRGATAVRAIAVA